MEYLPMIDQTGEMSPELEGQQRRSFRDREDCAVAAWNYGGICALVSENNSL
jgi:hypothetical protein